MPTKTTGAPSTSTKAPRRRGHPGGTETRHSSTEMPAPVDSTAVLGGAPPPSAVDSATVRQQPRPVEQKTQEEVRPAMPSLPKTPVHRAVQRVRGDSPAAFSSPAAQAFNQALTEAGLLRGDADLYDGKVQQFKLKVADKIGPELLAYQEEFQSLVAERDRLSDVLNALEAMFSPIAARCATAQVRVVGGNDELLKAIKLRDKFLEAACQEFVHRKTLHMQSSHAGEMVVMSPAELDAMVVQVDLFNQCATSLIEAATPSSSPVVQAYTPGKSRAAKATFVSWLTEERKQRLVEKRQEAVAVLQGQLSGWQYKAQFEGLLSLELDELSMEQFEFFDGFTAQGQVDADVTADASAQADRLLKQSKQKTEVMLVAAASLRWFTQSVCLGVCDSLLSVAKRQGREDHLSETLDPIAGAHDNASSAVAELYTAFEEAAAERCAIEEQLDRLSQNVVTIPAQLVSFQEQITVLAKLPSADAQRGLATPVVTAVSGGETTTMPAWQVVFGGLEGVSVEPDTVKSVLGIVATLEEGDKVDFFRQGFLGFVNEKLPAVIADATAVVAQVDSSRQRKELLFVPESPIWQLIYNAVESGSADLLTLLSLVSDQLEGEYRVDVFTNQLSSGNPLLFDILGHYPIQVDNMWRVLQKLSPEQRLPIWQSRDVFGQPLWSLLIAENEKLFSYFMADTAGISPEQIAGLLTDQFTEQTCLWAIWSSKEEARSDLLQALSGLNAGQVLEVLNFAADQGQGFLHRLIAEKPESIPAFMGFVEKHLENDWSQLLVVVDDKGRNPLLLALEVNPEAFAMLLPALLACSREVKKTVFEHQFQETGRAVLHQFVIAYSQFFQARTGVSEELAERFFNVLKSISEGHKQMDMLHILGIQDAEHRTGRDLIIDQAPALLLPLLGLVDMPLQIFTILVIDRASHSSVLGRMVIGGHESIVRDILTVMRKLDSSSRASLLTARVGLGIGADLDEEVLPVAELSQEGGALADLHESTFELESTLFHQVMASYPSLRIDFVEELKSLAPEDQVAVLLTFGGDEQRALFEDILATDPGLAIQLIEIIKGLPLEEKDRFLSTHVSSGNTFLMAVCQLCPAEADKALDLIEDAENRVRYFQQPNEERAHLLQMILMHAPHYVQQALELVGLEHMQEILCLGVPTVFDYMLRRNAGVYIVPENARSLPVVIKFLEGLGKERLIALLLTEELATTTSVVMDERVVSLLDADTLTSLIAKTRDRAEVSVFLEAQRVARAGQRSVIDKALGKMELLQKLQAKFTQDGEDACAEVCGTLLQFFENMGSQGVLGLSQYLSQLHVREGFADELKKGVWDNIVFRSLGSVVKGLTDAFGVDARITAVQRSSDVTANANAVLQIAADYPERLLEVLGLKRGLESFYQIVQTDLKTTLYLVAKVKEVVVKDKLRCSELKNPEVVAKANELRDSKLQGILVSAVDERMNLLTWCAEAGGTDIRQALFVVSLLELLSAPVQISCIQSGNISKLRPADLVDSAAVSMHVEVMQDLLQLLMNAFSAERQDIVPYLQQLVLKTSERSLKCLPIIYNSLPGLSAQKWHNIFFGDVLASAGRKLRLLDTEEIEGSLTPWLKMMVLHHMLTDSSDYSVNYLAERFSVDGKKKAHLEGAAAGGSDFMQFSFVVKWLFFNSEDVRAECGMNAEIIRFNLHSHLLAMLNQWVEQSLSAGKVLPCQGLSEFSLTVDYLQHLRGDDAQQGKLAALLGRPSALGHEVGSFFKGVFAGGAVKALWKQDVEAFKPSPSKRRAELKLAGMVTLAHVDKVSLTGIMGTDVGVRQIRGTMDQGERLHAIRTVLYAILPAQRGIIFEPPVSAIEGGEAPSWSLLSEVVSYASQGVVKPAVVQVVFELLETLELSKQMEVFGMVINGQKIIDIPVVQAVVSAKWVYRLVYDSFQTNKGPFLAGMETLVASKESKSLQQYYTLAKFISDLRGFATDAEGKCQERLVARCNRLSKGLLSPEHEPAAREAALANLKDFIGVMSVDALSEAEREVVGPMVSRLKDAWGVNRAPVSALTALVQPVAARKAGSTHMQTLAKQ